MFRFHINQYTLCNKHGWKAANTYPTTFYKVVIINYQVQDNNLLFMCSSSSCHGNCTLLLCFSTDHKLNLKDTRHVTNKSFIIYHYKLKNAQKNEY